MFVKIIIINNRLRTPSAKDSHTPASKPRWYLSCLSARLLFLFAANSSLWISVSNSSNFWLILNEFNCTNLNQKNVLFKKTETMKEFISKNTLLVITLTISISSFLAYLRLESDAKESAARIDNIISILKIPTQTQFNKDSLVNELKEGNFREDYYTKQLAMQSDWFILYVTALFGILSIIGFAYFSHEINRTKDYINEKIDDEQKKSMIHRMEFKELKIDHYQALGNISTIAALISIEQGLSVQTIKRSMEKT